MYKVALGAGHRLATPGKRLPKELDPNETREWVLNDRVCDYVEENLAAYDGVEILRVDDTNGVEEISIEERVAAANEWEADVVIAAHHNAAGRIFSGGGIVVYRDPLANDTETVSLQEEMYEALIRHTGLKGNRADPMAESALYVLRNTNAPAVLLELGFMDSTVDAPIILTDEFARQCAAAITEVIVRRAGLVRKEDNPVEELTVKAYKTAADVPEWYRPTIDKLMAAGALKGVDNKGTINVDEIYCRVMTTLDRLGLLDSVAKS